MTELVTEFVNSCSEHPTCDELTMLWVKMRLLLASLNTCPLGDMARELSVVIEAGKDWGDARRLIREIRAEYQYTVHYSLMAVDEFLWLLLAADESLLSAKSTTVTSTAAQSTAAQSTAAARFPEALRTEFQAFQDSAIKRKATVASEAKKTKDITEPEVAPPQEGILLCSFNIEILHSPPANCSFKARTIYLPFFAMVSFIACFLSNGNLVLYY